MHLTPYFPATVSVGKCNETVSVILLNCSGSRGVSMQKKPLQCQVILPLANVPKTVMMALSDVLDLSFKLNEAVFSYPGKSQF